MSVLLSAIITVFSGCKSTTFLLTLTSDFDIFFEKFFKPLKIINQPSYERSIKHILRF